MNRSWLPGLVLASVVLAAAIAALLMAGRLMAQNEPQGAPLRPATTSQPLQLPPAGPTPQP
jgi:hypothetical protein